MHPTAANQPIYDAIGHDYATHRQEDPSLFQEILNALAGAQTIVNVGAGAGSYEPRDRTVLAVEPSEVMARQRRAGSLPAIRATADHIPLHDGSVDAAMTVLSLHHWGQHQRAGILEMRRVARERVVIVTIDPRVSGQMWLMKDYLQEVAALDDEIFPLPEMICEWLGGKAEVKVIPTRRDITDGMLLSFWAHPERVMSPGARAATSGFARQPAHVVERVVDAIQRDLADGSWDQRYGALRALTELDAGLRLITAQLK
jgi:SAM-dependent methyltransferase